MNLIQWLRIIIYFIQTIISCYLLFWYFPQNITSDKPDNCSPQDKDDSSFFNGWVDKCDITIESSSKKNMAWLFYVTGIFKVVFDLLILYMLTLDESNIENKLVNRTVNKSGVPDLKTN